MSKDNPAFRNVVFTINNPTEDDLDKLRLMYKDAFASFVVAAHEVAATGTPHVQGYCELSKQTRQNRIKGYLPRAHLGAREGSAKQAAGYCCKGTGGEKPYDRWYPTYHPTADVFVDLGEITRPGKRTDVDQYADAILENKISRKEFAQQYPSAIIKFSRGIDALYNQVVVPRNPNSAKNVIVLWGPTGTGKTKTATERYPNHYLWGPEQGKWFNGYDSEPVLIMDEFRGCEHLSFAFLLRLLDRYPMRLETKGGFVQFVSDTVVITSPLPPEDWYVTQREHDNFDQLTRRITEVIHLTDPI